MPSPKNTLLVLVALDLFAVGLVVPIIPYIGRSLGATPSMLGLFTSVYGACQLLGGTGMGHLSDSVGRTRALMVSQLASALGYLMAGLAGSLTMLFLSRVPVGLCKQTVSLSQAYVSEVTEPEQRAAAIGAVAFAVNAGFMLGPVVGGSLTAYHDRLPAFAAAGILVLTAVLTAALLPEPSAERRQHKDEDAPKRNLFSMLGELMRTVSAGGPLAVLLVARFVTSLGSGLVHSVFSLYAQEALELDPSQTGFLLSFISVIGAVAQLVVVPALTKRLSEHALLRMSSLVVAASYAAWAAAPSLEVLVAILVPSSIGGAVLRTTMTSAVTKNFGKEHLGGLLGVYDSLESISRVLCPTIGGLLMDEVSLAAPLYAAGALTAGAAMLTFGEGETTAPGSKKKDD